MTNGNVDSAYAHRYEIVKTGVGQPLALMADRRANDEERYVALGCLGCLLGSEDDAQELMQYPVGGAVLHAAQAALRGHHDRSKVRFGPYLHQDISTVRHADNKQWHHHRCKVRLLQTQTDL